MKLRLTPRSQNTILMLLSLFHLGHSSCPDICQPCVAEHLYCVNPGLSEIPVSNEPRLTKVTIQKQSFQNTDLSSANFSSFIGISQLSIRSSNINRVLPSTFSKLTRLKQLDLSDNAELIVNQKAFEGLDLNLLKLDNMGIITLDRDAFLGLAVKSLSIQNSKLLTLPLTLMKPLSKSLLKLYLKNNLLRTLDPKLQPIFQGLEILELQKNPFICNCSILWLSKILESTSKKRSKPGDSALESSDELYPRCVSPSDLRKKFLHGIASKLKNCSPPRIIRIDVSFESYSSATIECFTEPSNDVHHQPLVGWLPVIDAVTEPRQLRSSLKVIRQISTTNYLCRATNGNGNSEIGFQINWLKQPSPLNHTLTPIKPRRNNTQTHRSILYRNVFSLFEMICAVLGTLVITVIIFIVIFCCHRFRIHLPFFEKERKFNYASTPPLYERAIYFDERRFCETDMDGRLFPPPPPTPPPFPMNRINL